ncbi:MAG: Tex family protein [Gemmataceae bacterium]
MTPADPTPTPETTPAAEPQPAPVAETPPPEQPQVALPSHEAAVPALPAAVEEPLGAAPVAQAPALPPQPVPQVPPAPQSHDLSRIAQDLQIRKAQVEAVVQLLDDGNTVPFITRYRKERTGGLDEVFLRRIQDRIQHLRDLAARKQTILRSIALQGKLTDQLTDTILHAEHPKRLEDLYAPYKQKKRTLATEAKERGLEPLALAIWNRDPAVEKLDEVLPGMVDPWKQLHDVNDVLTGVRHIVAEIIAESADVRGPMRAFYWDTAVLVTTKVETVPDGKGTEYRDYFNFKEPVRLIPPHRVLAVNRGERESIIRLRVDYDKEIAKRVALDNLPLADHPHREVLLPAVDDALDRLLMPSLEREARRELTEHAQDHAVDIFARNLSSLLMRPPLVGKRVLAIDPGQRTGCKLAVLDETGALLEDAVIYPHPPQKKPAEAKRKLEQLIRKYQTPVIAIGNGTACRETETLVSELLAEFEARRLNPPPAESPIPPVTAATDAPAEPAPPAAPAETVAVGHPAETVSVAAPAITFAETTLVPGVGAGETAVVTAAPADAPPAESAVVQSPAVLPPPAPAKPADPPISLEGLPEPPADIVYVIVNEAGASDYSASPVAKEEFPNLDATTRGTVSIGRRLQDPLAELVKVDPQHVGVGLYQHDVRPKYLKQSVETVIESCVNAVGVDLNTASVPLLRHVSGLNQLAAREIVQYRQQHGAFKTREQLKSVPQMGEARFTQAAGFLQVRGGDDPLDNTWVHPESYGIARQVLAEFGFTPEDLRDRDKLQQFREKIRGTHPGEVAQKLGAGEPTVWDIYDALAKPGRDPREDRPAPIFRKGVLNLEDLKPGMELKGEVLNVVDFGAFVDVGLKDSGLVHISQMANRYIKSPYDVIAVGDVVSVWVMGVDPDRRRVSLSMIPPGGERRPPERPRQQDRPPRAERPQGPPQQQRERSPQPPAHADRPVGQRPGFAPRPQGQPQGQGGRPGFAPRPGGQGGGPRPRGPGAPGWRSSPKPPPAPGEAAPAAAGQQPAAEAPAAPPPPAKKPPRPKSAPKLSDTQKTGKEPVYSFAQLAALLTTKKEDESKPADSPPPADPPAAG